MFELQPDSEHIGRDVSSFHKFHEFSKRPNVRCETGEAIVKLLLEAPAMKDPLRSCRDAMIRPLESGGGQRGNNSYSFRIFSTDQF